MHSIFVALSSFISTIWITNKLRSRRSFEKWQQNKLSIWLTKRLPEVEYYEKSPRNLQALPITDKVTVMAQFEDFNSARITTNDAWQAIENQTTCRNYTVGASTGTSGNRGLFVISNKERFLWLGNILAKTLPDILWRRHRVAIILPHNTTLYDSAQQSKRVELKFFNLRLGPESWINELENFAPTCIVAPPKILKYLAEQNATLKPAKVFSAAETLDLGDQKFIEQYFGLQLGQIYMATEGLFAVSCKEGKLHLAEDAVKFEFEDAGNGLVSPLVTCFRRDAQIMARYRMNDLLKLSKEKCACGSPLQAVDEVVGRLDDCFQLECKNGQVILLSPDILRNIVVDADRRISDYRLIQTGANNIELHLPNELSLEVCRRTQIALKEFFSLRNVNPDLAVLQKPLVLNVERKLRRIENQFSNGSLK